MQAENLNLWIQYISSQSVPVLRNTIQSVLTLCSDERSTCKQLADTIMRDPAITARVLRIANSPYYNRSSTRLADIRQAVLLIGFDKILNISLTVAIVNALVKKDTMQYIITLMVNSLRTAMLAQTIARKFKLQHIDDIYVAGLLFNFGEIAFWSLSGRSGQEILSQLTEINQSRARAQRELLGVTFQELTVGLSSKWHLSLLLESALLHPDREDPYIQSLVLSHDLINSINTDEQKFERCIVKLAKYLQCPPQETADLVHQQYEISTRLSYYYLIHR